MESIGGAELTSVFPPPPCTLLGAVRSAIGDAYGVDWHEFKTQAKNHPLFTKIGFGDDLGPLSLSGPWVCYDGKDSKDGNCQYQRLYPIPLFLLAKSESEGENKKPDFIRLRIGDAVQTYLGRVRLPELPGDTHGYKPLEQAWITKEGLEAVLAGNTPEPGTIHYAKDLFERETRLGIALDHTSHTVQDGLLYQTKHVRPKPCLAIEADISFATDTLLPTGLVRLGAEGRLASVSKGETPKFLTMPKSDAKTKGIILVLLTPAHFGHGLNGWLPPGFEAREEHSVLVWKGKIADIALTLHAAIMNKVRRKRRWIWLNINPDLSKADSCGQRLLHDGR